MNRFEVNGRPTMGGQPTRGGGGSQSVNTSPDAFIAKYAAQAQNLTGLTDESLQLLLPPNNLSLPINIGYTFANRGGTSSVRPGNQVRVDGTGGIIKFANTGALILLQNTKRFFAIGQMRLQTLPTAQSRIYFQVGLTTVCAVAVGVDGTTNPNRWGFACNNTVAAAPALNVGSTRTPFVGALVTSRIWYDGDFIWGSVDNETPVQIADASKMLASPVGDFYFDSFPIGGHTDIIDIGPRFLVWGET